MSPLQPPITPLVALVSLLLLIPWDTTPKWGEALQLGGAGSRSNSRTEVTTSAYPSYPTEGGHTYVENTTGAPIWEGNPTEYTIGGVLSGLEGVEHYFTQILSDVERLKLNNLVSLNYATQTMDSNPIRTAINVCSQLIKRKVYAIVVSKPKSGDLSPASVSYTAGFYHIPVIGISSRDSAFSDKNIHVSFLRTVPPYSHQADVWVEMLKIFKYRQLVFIHSSDTDGRALLGRFQTKTQDLQAEDQEVKVQVEKIEEFEPGKSSYYDTLSTIKECQARVYFLYASTEDADQIFRDATNLNMTGEGYVWIVTEQALLSQTIPSGTLGLQLVSSEGERGHISDSLNILAQALENLHKNENVTEAPGNCNKSGNVWESGRKFFEYIRKQILAAGVTGRVAFDDMGDRLFAEYKVINVQADHRNNFPKGVKVGNYKYSEMSSKMHLEINEDAIIWPGGLTQKPTGLMIPTHLKVVTIFEKPFVYTRKLNVSSTEVFHNLRQMETANSYSSSNSFSNNFNKQDVASGSSSNNNNNNHGNGMKVSWSDFADLGLDKAKVDSSSTAKPPPEMANSDKSGGGQGQTASAPSDISKPSRKLPENACDPTYGEVPCPAYNKHWNEDDPDSKTYTEEMYCCRGYCIDLLHLLSSHSNFTFSLHLAQDEYGTLERNNLTGKQEWTGLMGELVGERADMIVAPLTINPERAQVIEFSKPFKYQGITILQKRQPRASQLVSFLQPFKYTLWVLVLVSVHVVALCLYLLDRFSPFGHLGSPSRGHSDEHRAVELLQREESLNFTSAIWFAWGVLLNSGIGEGTPRSFSARVLGMVWAGFAMIIVASYTANLAAFLVLDKPRTSLTGINDPRLRNPMENFTYATVKGSAVDLYFRRQVELSNMYRTMEGKHFPSPEKAIQAVKEGKLHAFIWDSSRLEFEAAHDCDLITAGDLFGRSGYGVGLQKGSPWADKVTLAILHFHESGKMEELDNKWILLNNNAMQCHEKDDNSPATLGLKNMRGVFILVGVGIAGGLGLIVIEIVYKKHQMRKQKRHAIARTAIYRWKSNIQKRRVTRHTKHFRANGVRASVASDFTETTPDSIATISVGSLPHRDLYPDDSTWRLAMEARIPIASHSVTRGDYRQNIGTTTSLQRPKSAQPVRHYRSQEQLNESYTPKSPILPTRRSAPRLQELNSSPIKRGCTQHPPSHFLPKHGLAPLPAEPLNTGPIRHVRAPKSPLVGEPHHIYLQPPPHYGALAKSPSSSDSSKKKLNAVVMIQPPAKGSKLSLTGGRKKPKSLWPMDKSKQVPKLPEPRAGLREEDFLSSPEYPTVTLDLTVGPEFEGELRHRGIPKPPPPPKLYWQNKRQHPGGKPAHKKKQHHFYDPYAGDYAGSNVSMYSGTSRTSKGHRYSFEDSDV
ncbi:glutamate [NMDA] receptor subunit 1-like isoform X1 [Tigriopus californicus]|uniref:glutamate [NMDA] receptor subunit 1-like isoform X1 n=1 Tax=Tigriopus californicus TaxID=6832 RepID=UPI0027DA4640|nr:glutamate [NMDA] receptor subunit 1-like isoform X1 [Tigriopus californicus]